MIEGKKRGSYKKPINIGGRTNGHTVRNSEAEGAVRNSNNLLVVVKA